MEYHVIDVACTTSNPYVRHTGAMLHSLLAHTPADSVRVNILHLSPIGAEERGRFEHVTKGAALRFFHIPDSAVAGLPLGYFSKENWLRIFLPELMPSEDKVIYLDSDLIITDDLSPLWQIPLRDHPLAAVTNPFYPFMAPHYRTVGIEDARDYFNSGVLPMNLDLMRREGFADRIWDFARRNPELKASDQDALNVVCRDRWLRLHPRWNVQSPMFECKAAELPLPTEEVAEALASPAIIHYIGASKPWHYQCTHPKRALYAAHARMTPWGEAPLIGRNLRTMVLRRLPQSWTYRSAAWTSVLRDGWAAVRGRKRRKKPEASVGAV